MHQRGRRIVRPNLNGGAERMRTLDAEPIEPQAYIAAFGEQHHEEDTERRRDDGYKLHTAAGKNDNFFMD